MLRQCLSSLLIAVTLVGMTGCAGPAPTAATSPKAPSNDKSGALVYEGGNGANKSSGALAGAPRSPGMPLISGAMADGGKGGPWGGEDMFDRNVNPEQQRQVLNAGSVDDNAEFEKYLAYLKGYHGNGMRPLDVSERHVLKVVDTAGKPVGNAEVTVSQDDTVLFRGKSYANGELLFHPKAASGAAQAQDFEIKATKGQTSQTARFDRKQEGAWELKLDLSAQKASPKLDVLFLIDATGSMGGEIARLQDTIKTISSRIRELDGQPSTRFGLVAYRDQGDAYVTASADFTADIDAFKTSLDQVRAEGGGDKPEDVESGLAKAIQGASWATDDTVRLVFLVADAAPHVDYQQATPYTTSALKAAEKGIKLFPIGCSGLEPEGEYAFRQMAQLTMGQYLFITRGGDELTGGGGKASATVDNFQEGRLDNIVVDIVKAELGSRGQ